MTSFFYVVSIAFHTSVSVLRKCMNTSRKNILLAESAATRAPGRGESVTELMPYHELPSPLVHLLWWQTYITILNVHSSMNVDGFHPFTTINGWQMLFMFGACCKRGRHLYTTTTTPSCYILASYCHLSATLQTMSIIVVNLQDIRIFIALLRFSFDSPSYLPPAIQS